MTNSRLTDPEILETRLPVRLEQFAIRRGSGGQGAHTGGDGVVREVTFLEPMRANILANRRRVPPRGIDGGSDAQAGRNWVERTDGSVEMLSATASAEVQRGRPLRDRNAGRRRVREARRMINYWPLLGIALVVVGFALRFNPLLVVAVAAIVTGLLGGMDFLKVLATLGKAFNDNRYVTIIYIVLPVIGLLERYGLAAAGAGADRRNARRDGRATADRLSRPFARSFAALGLTSVAGHAADRAAARRADGAGRGREAARQARRGRPRNA